MDDQQIPPKRGFKFLKIKIIINEYIIVLLLSIFSNSSISLCSVYNNFQGKQQFKSDQMFSYMTGKHSQSTFENNLIEQIQDIANQIFDHQASTVAKTQQQEMSLQLSPATSQDGNTIPRKHSYENQEQNGFDDSPKNQHFLARYIQSVNPKDQTSKKQQGKKDHSSKRLTKSMISGQGPFKEPGAFSNNYLASNKVSMSQVTPSKQLSRIQKYENRNNLQPGEQSKQQVLHQSNQNQSNILQGILSGTNKKSPNRKKGDLNLYGQKYISPYSSKGMKNNPKSFMQKSNSQIKKPKQSIQLQYIKKRINENIEPQISYRKQKNEISKLKNPKLSNIKSKFKEGKPLLHEYKRYVDEHIYKKLQTQMAVYEQKKKKYQTLSNQEIQDNWNQFIQKEAHFLEQKKQRIITRKLQNMHQENSLLAHSPNKNIHLGGKSSRVSLTPTKLTPEDFVKKYKRQKEKLKQKLAINQISNFVEKSFENSKRFGKEVFQSVWGSTFNKKQADSSFVEAFSTIPEHQIGQQQQISKFLNDNQERDSKKIHQNFFVSVGSDSYPKKSHRKSKTKQARSNQKGMLAKSSIMSNQGNRRKSKDQRSTSRQHQSNGKKQVNSLSPFIKRSSYFSVSERKIQLHEFDPRKHNSPKFNEQLKSRNSRSKPKPEQASNKKVSQLLNPKYFKSINELEQYKSNNSRKMETKRKTFSNQTNENDSVVFVEGREYSPQFQNPNNIIQEKKIMKNRISGFDHKLMGKIIEDLQHMRTQIQQNKKKRKFRIQNYRNFTNVRQEASHQKERRESSSNRKNSFQNNSKMASDGRQRKTSQNQPYNWFRNQEKQGQDRIKRSRQNKHIGLKFDELNLRRISIQPETHSRSVSPIEQEDSICESRNNNLSVSMIHQFSENANEPIKNSNVSDHERQLSRSSMIMVKSRQEVDFVFGS